MMQEVARKWKQFRNWYRCRVREKHLWIALENDKVVKALWQFGKDERYDWVECEICGQVSSQKRKWDLTF
jgi:hypothetical protein